MILQQDLSELWFSTGLILNSLFQQEKETFSLGIDLNVSYLGTLEQDTTHILGHPISQRAYHIDQC